MNLPVRFIGGLTVEPVPSRLEFPFQGGQQDICIGQPIPAGTLRGLPLAERSALVVKAINALAPENELPLPSAPGYSLSEGKILFESLRFATRLCEESQAVLKMASGEIMSPAPRAWTAEFAASLRDVGI